MSEQIKRHVSWLVCHKHVEMAAESIASVARCSSEKIFPVIHDDGSLNDEDCSRLKGIVGGRVIRKPEADSMVADLLVNYPNLSKYRRMQVYALKLIDTILLDDSSLLTFIDADVLFWRKFIWPETDNSFIFCRDRENSYSFRSWQKMLRGVSLAEKVNSGIVIVNRDSFDFEFADWIAKQACKGSISGVIEQTIWSAVAFRNKCYCIDEKHLRVMRENEDSPEVGGHFTAKTRHLWQHYAERSKASNGILDPIQLRVVPAGECTAVDLLKYECKRLFARFGGSFAR